jgi:ATP-dependent Clp protease ATP-binding subunit ClpC
MERHTPSGAANLQVLTPGPPRWSTLRRAVELAVAERTSLPKYPFERFTSTAQMMLTAAQTEAERGGVSYIGTEHLLLASFADRASHAAQLLSKLHVTDVAVRNEIELALRHKGAPQTERIIPTSGVKKVIDIAFMICAAAGESSVTTGHILLALAREGRGIAARVLTALGVTAENIESEMATLTEAEL